MPVDMQIGCQTQQNLNSITVAEISSKHWSTTLKKSKAETVSLIAIIYEALSKL